MKMNKPLRLLLKYIPYPDLGSSHSFVEWKNRLLFVVLAGMIVLGFIAYVPSVILAAIEKVWMVIVLDTLVYAVVLYATFSRKMSSEVKVKIILITFYILGIALLILLGQKGAGFNWLFVFPLLSSFFYGYRGIAVSTVINLVSLTLLSFPIYFEWQNFGQINEYDFGGWIVNSVNFLAITSLLSLALTVILGSIDKSLKKEQRMNSLLEKHRDQLSVEKNKAQESEQLKSAFVANMSHEIRTPLNAIIGFSHLMSKGNLPPEKMMHYGSLIDMSGKQLTGIIDDIIDISKIEQGQMAVHTEPVGVYSSLQDVIDIQRNRVETLKKDIRIEYHVPKKLKDLVINTDEIRFKQIAGNIIGNAVKYTEKGIVRVGYKLKQTEEKMMAEFFVKDTGRGIPAEDHERIFNRFSQAGNVDFQEGTGLGLSITRGLLDLLGGDIWLKSELHKGSEFYFTLPAEDARVAVTEKVENDEVHDFSSSVEGKLIYIAEDDEFSYYLLEEMLRPLNLRIKQAANGKELLDLMNQDTPDLVLLDIRMPVMSGLEALKEIRKRHTDIPVIAQSAHVLPEERQECFNQGCNDYISKPVEQDILFGLFEKYLL